MFRPDEILNQFLSNTGQITSDWVLPSFGAIPKKTLHTPDDINKWSKSKGLGLLLTTLLQFTDSVEGVTEIPAKLSEETKIILDFFHKINLMTLKLGNQVESSDDIRFGNPKVMDLYKWIYDNTPVHLNSLSTVKTALKEELFYYFNNSFGSSRLDFGSGHELSFLAFMTIIYKSNENADFSRELVLVIYSQYITLIRGIIKIFHLEPAGTTILIRESWSVGS
eukprot:NODE_8_length_66115_cov_0.981823.p35 type:complete len:223 gc:universal NODE_8_length_66115_cov_0.981823:54961-55629(+)